MAEGRRSGRSGPREHSGSKGGHAERWTDTVNGAGTDEHDGPGARTIGARVVQRWARDGGGVMDDTPLHGPRPIPPGPRETSAGLVDFGAVRVPVPPDGQVMVERHGRLRRCMTPPAGRRRLARWPHRDGGCGQTSPGDRPVPAPGGASVRSFTGEWGRELHARTGEASSVFVGVDGALLDALRGRHWPDQHRSGAGRRAAAHAARDGRRARPLPVPGADGAAAHRARRARGRHAGTAGACSGDGGAGAARGSFGIVAPAPGKAESQRRPRPLPGRSGSGPGVRRRRRDAGGRTEHGRARPLRRGPEHDTPRTAARPVRP